MTCYRSSSLDDIDFIHEFTELFHNKYFTKQDIEIFTDGININILIHNYTTNLYLNNMVRKTKNIKNCNRCCS